MYLVCISFGGIPRKLPKFPAFSAENKTFNKINGTLPKVGRGGNAQARLPGLQRPSFGDRLLLSLCC